MTIFRQKDPTKAAARVTLADLQQPLKDPLPGYLNPTTLSYAIEVGVGKLNPVGAPHTVLQYGHTNSPTVPIELYFSTQMTYRVSHLPPQTFPLRRYVDWFGSFCFPTQTGAAPPVLSILWPKTVNMALVIESFSADYVSFHSEDLAPKTVQVSLQCIELRFTYRNASEHKTTGFTKLDGMISKVIANTGAGMNLKG